MSVMVVVLGRKSLDVFFEFHNRLKWLKKILSLMTCV